MYIVFRSYIEQLIKILEDSDFFLRITNYKTVENIWFLPHDRVFVRVFDHAHVNDLLHNLGFLTTDLLNYKSHVNRCVFELVKHVCTRTNQNRARFNTRTNIINNNINNNELKTTCDFSRIVRVRRRRQRWLRSPTMTWKYLMGTVRLI